MRSAITLGFVLAVSAPSLSIAAVSGEAVYKERCAPCHDSGSSRVPARDELKKLPVGRIIRAMDFGLMSNVASKLRQDEREAVAAYLGVPGNNSQPPASAYCTDRSVKLTNGAKAEWNGWSTTTTNARYQPADAASLTLAQISRLQLKWAYGFDGDITAFHSRQSSLGISL